MHSVNEIIDKKLQKEITNVSHLINKIAYLSSLMNANNNITLILVFNYLKVIAADKQNKRSIISEFK